MVNFWEGLIGQDEGSTFDQCYAHGSIVEGSSSFIGGFIGHAVDSYIQHSFSTVDIHTSSGSDIGGLIGYGGRLTILNCYATGPVAGYRYIGGLIGYDAIGSTTEYCYTTGKVTGSINFGEFFGNSDGNFLGKYTRCYYLEDPAISAAQTNVTSKTDSQLRQQATFAGWDFTDIWGIVEYKTYPHFQPTTPVPVTIEQASTQNDPALVFPIEFDISFDEAVKEFVFEDLSFVGSTVSPTGYISDTGNRADYKLYITGTNGEGTVVVNLPAEAAMSLAHHPTAASTSTDNSVTLRYGNMLVTGNGQVIEDGDTTPEFADDTYFGEVTVSSSSNKTYTIVNQADYNLELTGTPLVSISGSSNFTLATPPTSPIAVSDTSDFTVTYSPTALTTETAEIQIDYTGDDSPYTFIIEGTGMEIPTILTEKPTEITTNSATCYTDLVSDGNSTIIQRGVCWSSSPNPTISGNRTIDASDLGRVQTTFGGLTIDRTYYIRAYATNAAGTGYGDEISFRSAIPIDFLVQFSWIGHSSYPNYPMNGTYYLTRDIDASDTANPSMYGPDGFSPVGGIDRGNGPFTGHFNGGNHTISNLYMNNTHVNIGLFGTVYGGTICNTHLVNAAISGRGQTGALCGYLVDSDVLNCSATGIVNGWGNTGGLIGSVNTTTYPFDPTYTIPSSVRRSFSSCTVTSIYDDFVGGLIGQTLEADISDCYATGQVISSSSYVSRFISRITNTRIYNSYTSYQVSSGNVSGFCSAYGTILDGVTTISNCYYLDDPLAVSGVATPKTSGQLRQETTFVDWDFDDTWTLEEGKTYPTLEPVDPVSVTITKATGQDDPAATLPFNFDITFERPVYEFVFADLSFAGSAVTDIAGLLTDTGNHKDYTLSITSVTGGGDLVVTLPSFETMDKENRPNGTSNETSVSYPFTTVDILGNSTLIDDGDTTPSTIDHTDFGTTNIYTGTIVRTFTVENTGDVPATFTGTPLVALSGANSSEFAVTVTPTSPLAVSDTTTFEVTFDPSSPAPKYAEVSVAFQHMEQSPYTFAIQGNAIGLPTVSTGLRTGFTVDTATFESTVSSDGNLPLTARGVCWSTTNPPTLSDSYTEDDTSSSTVESEITGLVQGATYYVRAYATNSWGTSYGTVRTFTTAIPISSLTDLESIGNLPSHPLNGNYFVTQDIDASDTLLTSYNGGIGFNPIGHGISDFTGFFEGNNKIISNLYINRTNNYTGLFGISDNATIRNTHLSEVEVSGANNVGALCGATLDSDIYNCSVTGSISGTGYNVGGLIGESYFSSIEKSFATSIVTTNGNLAGGLIGYLYDGTISNCYSTGSVNGSSNVGGLIGFTEYPIITNCYSTSKVTSPGVAGELIGYSYSTIITSSFYIDDTAVFSTYGTARTITQLKQQGNIYRLGFH